MTKYLLLLLPTSVYRCTAHSSDQSNTNANEITTTTTSTIFASVALAHISSALQVRPILKGLPEQNLWQVLERVFFRPDAFHVVQAIASNH